MKFFNRTASVTCSTIFHGAMVIDRLPDGYEAADPYDAWLLALAGVGGADYLVTGDTRSGLLAR